MKRMMILLCLPLLCSCAVQDISSEELVQTSTVCTSEPLTEPAIPEGRVPLNFPKQVGRWIPYLQYPELMTGKNEEQFRSGIRNTFSQALADGVNTLYVHVRPAGDAYYESDIFPRGAALDGEYDPLSIMTEEAHALGMSIHAWINPLRLQTAEQMQAVPERYITRQWADQGKYARLVNGRWYLVPVYEEVRTLLADEVRELLEKYPVDGIHIDDYFYPTTSPDFDSDAFAASGSNDLSQWRLDNISAMVKSIYNTVKSRDSRLLFGISPQGKISANYDTQYADVKLWAGTSGYCDYIVPQIYYGFLNETAPFGATLSEWEVLRGDSGVSLIIGLAGYKEGREDAWAGEAGELEWIEDDTVLSRQIALVEGSSADGYAVYY
ncbi:MAG: family 10 glycosylhydrolase [Ruminococcus sp.]|nr:family 10 glycosylhydrolase [Ruminococcus sp.]